VTIQRLDDYLEVRCPNGLPEPVSEAVQDPLLMGLG
jgi:hypothetical protein